MNDAIEKLFYIRKKNPYIQIFNQPVSSVCYQNTSGSTQVIDIDIPQTADFLRVRFSTSAFYAIDSKIDTSSGSNKKGMFFYVPYTNDIITCTNNTTVSLRIANNAFASVEFWNKDNL